MFSWELIKSLPGKFWDEIFKTFCVLSLTMTLAIICVVCYLIDEWPFVLKLAVSLGVFSIGGFTVRAINKFGLMISTYLSNQKKLKQTAIFQDKILQHLDCLTEKEKQTICSMVSSNQKNIDLYTNSSVAISLSAKGIIYRASEKLSNHYSNLAIAEPYIIHDFVWEALQRDSRFKDSTKKANKR